MIETFPAVVSEAFLQSGGLTVILGTLYAAIWFTLGGLWVIRMVRRGWLVIPPD